MFYLSKYDSLKAQWSALDSTSHTLIAQGMQKTHNENYTEAIETFEKLIDLHPQYPLGYFSTAAVYHTIMRNYRVKTFEVEFDSLLNLAIKIGEKQVRNDRKDALSHFYLGGAYGFRGFHEVRKGDWLGAFRDGWKGISCLQRVVIIEPELYDAYYGLGTYHYWRSAKAKILRFLPFMKNETQRGIEEVWLSINKGKYTTIEGKYALVAIYYDDKNYKEALSINQQLYELFPSNPACLYMRARIFEQLENWEESNECFENLLDHLSKSEYKSIGYQIECFYRIGLCLHKLGEFDSSLKQVEIGLNLKNNRDASKELEGPLENSSEILKKLNELNKTLKKRCF